MHFFCVEMYYDMENHSNESEIMTFLNTRNSLLIQMGRAGKKKLQCYATCFI